MSNPLDPRHMRTPQDKKTPVDRTFVEGSTPAQPSQDYRSGAKVNSTLSGSVNQYTMVPLKTQTGYTDTISTVDMLPTGNEPVPLGSGTIVSLLGSGGMARVYKIWNEKLEVFRAAKILIPGQSDLKNRFDTEAKITAKLHHPNIVEIYNVGEWKNLPYLEMEYVDGDSLEAFIAKFGVLPPEVCGSIAIFVARALSYAHSQEFLIYGKNYHGVIHRDLKPANIMIAKCGEVRLMDFGIARPTEASLHTVDGNIVGTMQYLSPEQMDGVDIDNRTDIYSLGAILYEMLTGTKTFPQDTITNLMKKKILNDYRKFSDFDFDIHSGLSKISQRCLQLDKRDRFSDVEALLRELEIVHRSLSNDPPGKVLKLFLNNPDSFKKSTKKSSSGISPKIFIPIIGGVLVTGVITLVVLTDPDKEKTTASSTVNLKKDTVNVAVHTPPTGTTPLAQLKDTTYGTSVPTSPIKKDSVGPVVQKPVAPTKNKPVIKPTITPPPKPVELATVVEPPVPEQLSPIERLQKKYSVTDPVAIGKSALATKAYQDAITALETTPDNHPDHKIKTLLLLQAYIETGRTKDALFIVNSESPSDAQYDFLCGRLYEMLGKSKQSFDFYQKALTKPSVIRDRSVIKNDALYHTALLWSSLHKSDPNSENRIQALNAWNIVKKTYTSSPQSDRFKKANQELASIQ